jgi:FkbM family methyltransferase
MLRGVVRRLGRNLVISRRWPARFGGGRVYVSPDAVLGVLRRDLENVDPELFVAATRLVRAGDRIWDIGANQGLFAFAAAHVAGPKGEVLAVEPDAWLVNLMRRSARRRPGGAPVRVLAAAVCERMGMVELHVARAGRAGNFIGGSERSVAGGTREVQPAAGITLDWLLEQAGAPTLVKIDVEGLEARVLRGATRLLSEARPRLYVEVGKEAAQEVGSILERTDYRLLSIEGTELREVARPQWNTVAVPNEQLAQLVREPAMRAAADPAP